MRSLSKERVDNLFTYRGGMLFNKKGSRAGWKRGVYRFVSVDGATHCEHRVIYLMHKGKLPKVVDHIVDSENSEGIKNNNIENLQGCSNRQNIRKSRKLRGASKYKGVTKHGKRWRARITYRGKTRHLGSYTTQEEAGEVYDKEALRLFGNRFVWTNFQRN